MPLYELQCITAHFTQYAHIQSLVKVSAQGIIARGGVVREIKSLGTKALPQRMRSHKTWHDIADYWIMRFDASPKSMKTLTAALKQDPRVVRWTTLKLGERLQDMLGSRAQTID
ncbi:hypothetical protein CALVIDRAFT_424273 [Calocera viscosa TUFC12733]|uniref:Ribosomal protein S6 n=1 Tax=Calocera viscosa (strain TUFC12733) TaxID=1330018 RepID=A0A167PJ52_CALVF|nr:hypothetical protein CALVIDRAFT_424273 [Calocera viscosa TUFC12733]